MPSRRKDLEDKTRRAAVLADELAPAAGDLALVVEALRAYGQTLDLLDKLDDQAHIMELMASEIAELRHERAAR